MNNTSLFRVNPHAAFRSIKKPRSTSTMYRVGRSCCTNGKQRTDYYSTVV